MFSLRLYCIIIVRTKCTYVSRDFLYFADLCFDNQFMPFFYLVQEVVGERKRQRESTTPDSEEKTDSKKVHEEG